MQQNMASPLHHEFLLYTSNMFVHIGVDSEEKYGDHRHKEPDRI